MDKASTPYPSTDRLNDVVAGPGAGYRTAQPFPHVVIDNLFSEEVLDAVLAEFPSPTDIDWIRFNKPGEERKLASRGEDQFGEATKELMWYLNSPTFIAFLEQMTGIEGLVADPNLWGGGLHQSLRGGKLGIHADFNKHSKLKLDRRLNLLVYLNKDWKDEYGGHLELWDAKMEHCVKKVLPIYNRAVVFSTDDTSFHGHPDPLTCPEDRTRKSLALYYYTNGRPDPTISHSTLFQKRPGETEYRKVVPNGMKDLLKWLLPPILIDLVRPVWDRLRR